MPDFVVHLLLFLFKCSPGQKDEDEVLSERAAAALREGNAAAQKQREGQRLLPHCCSLPRHDIGV